MFYDNLKMVYSRENFAEAAFDIMSEIEMHRVMYTPYAHLKCFVVTVVN